jgi:hypothetical protein
MLLTMQEQAWRQAAGRTPGVPYDVDLTRDVANYLTEQLQRDPAIQRAGARFAALPAVEPLAGPRCRGTGLSNTRSRIFPAPCGWQLNCQPLGADHGNSRRRWLPRCRRGRGRVGGWVGGSGVGQSPRLLTAGTVTKLRQQLYDRLDDMPGRSTRRTRVGGVHAGHHRSAGFPSHHPGQGRSDGPPTCPGVAGRAAAACDPQRYRQRHAVECGTNQFKQHGAAATRFGGPDMPVRASVRRAGQFRDRRWERDAPRIAAVLVRARFLGRGCC